MTLIFFVPIVPFLLVEYSELWRKYRQAKRKKRAKANNK